MHCKAPSHAEVTPESIELFIEDQDICRRIIIDLAPFPDPSPVSKLSPFLSLPVCQSSLLTGGRGGEKPHHLTAGKPGSLKVIHYSLDKMHKFLKFI